MRFLLASFAGPKGNGSGTRPPPAPASATTLPAVGGRFVDHSSGIPGNVPVDNDAGFGDGKWLCILLLPDARCRKLNLQNPDSKGIARRPATRHNFPCCTRKALFFSIRECRVDGREFQR